jgi:hypothetical protein
VARLQQNPAPPILPLLTVRESGTYLARMNVGTAISRIESAAASRLWWRWSSGPAGGSAWRWRRG